MTENNETVCHHGIVAFSPDNEQYKSRKYLKHFFSKIYQDPAIHKVTVCVGCTLQRWNKMSEGYDEVEATRMTLEHGNVLEEQVGAVARDILKEKYCEVVRWEKWRNDTECQQSVKEFDNICSKENILSMFRELLGSFRDDRLNFLRHEIDINQRLEAICPSVPGIDVSWEFTMMSSVLEYIFRFIKKFNPDKFPNVYSGRDFGSVLEDFISNCYNYLSEEAVIIYKFWNFDSILYPNKITPILDKAHRVFTVQQRQLPNKLYWHFIKLSDQYVDVESTLKDEIESHIKTQRIQMTASDKEQFKESITNLMQLLENIKPRELRLSLKLLANTIVSKTLK